MAQSLSQPAGPIDRAVRRPSPLRRLLPLLLILVGGGVAAWYFFGRPQSKDLTFSGRIEGYETDVGTKVAGKVAEVTVREGAAVHRGDLLVRLDADELKAQLKGAEARLKSAQQQQENARLQVAVLTSQIAEAQLKVTQSQGDTEGRVSQAEAQVAAAIAQQRQAQAQVTEAQAQLNLARLDRDRYASLSRDGAVSKQRSDQANTSYQAAQATLASRQAAVVAAQRQVVAAQAGVTQSQSTSLNPDINSAQVERLNTQLEQARVQLASAQSQVADADATRQQIQAQLDNLTINSPIDGVVTARSVEPGVAVSAGKVLLSVLDLNTVYMRGFIPEGQIGAVHVGQAAQVFLDSDPDHPLEAKVIAIDTQASFTPENIYFKDDRVQQVFGIRLGITTPGGLAKPGMPADGAIVLDKRSGDV